VVPRGEQGAVLSSLFFPLLPSSSLFFPLLPSSSLFFPLLPSSSLRGARGKLESCRDIYRAFRVCGSLSKAIRLKSTRMAVRTPAGLCRRTSYLPASRVLPPFSKLSALK
jgi:hypothetical protein